MAIENPSRRQLLRGQFLQSLHSENAKIQGINAIRPPWSVNEADFTDKCTRCGKHPKYGKRNLYYGDCGYYPIPLPKAVFRLP